MRRSGKKGFTLIELLIVIAIIGILAAVLLPQLLRARQAAATRAADAHIRNVYTAGQAYLSENITATAADVEPEPCGSGGDFDLGGYTVDAVGANIVGACDIVNTAGVLSISFTYGTGTTLSGTGATFP